MTTLKTGDLAPSFTLPRLRGAPQGLPGAKGPFSVVVFVKQECETSQLVMPFVGRLARAFGEQIPFGVVVENEAEEGREMAQLGSVSEEIIYLEPAPYETSAAYGLFSVPTLFIISAEQTIEGSIIGWSRAQYEALVERLSQATQRPKISLITEADGKVPNTKPG